MADSKDYWIERERDNITREQMKDAEVAERLKKIINQALREAEKEIYSFYAKYADKNEISKTEAKKRVSEMDVQAFEETAARYVREKNFSEKANRELMTYNTKMRINRQELLMMQVNAHLVAMANDQINVFQNYLEQAGVYEVARQAGIIGANIVISQETLLSIVGASFYGAKWSDRIWSDMKALREELEVVINSSITRGVHPQRSIAKIRERFDVTTFEARRLLITETARVQTDAQKLSFEALAESDEEQEYEFVAKRDKKTSETCENLDGKRFKVIDMMPGVNAPPMHPFCRSGTMLVLGEWRDKLFGDEKEKYIL
ncbi:minor capsid protein [Halobacillus sp. HZG1]|uniref:minor capsid protein n=1 Tax=Halobacillus sp. HZG1 TaxID=3111769 RepID=UPI002DBD467D|nr:minor capsid protein [Halobacillus sp. HZG1]MEC3884590.1 minor capsid protein [Halobacillus sp. HZG1]